MIFPLKPPYVIVLNPKVILSIGPCHSQPISRKRKTWEVPRKVAAFCVELRMGLEDYPQIVSG
jgi:hypothetical protein